MASMKNIIRKNLLFLVESDRKESGENVSPRSV